MEEISREPGVHPSRLCAAADALLVAIRSPRGFNARVSMHVGPSRIGASPPREGYTVDELLEAMAMLIRLGLDPADVASHREWPSSR